MKLLLLLLLPVHGLLALGAMHVPLPSAHDPRVFWLAVCVVCASMLWLAARTPMSTPDP